MTLPEEDLKRTLHRRLDGFEPPPEIPRPTRHRAKERRAASISAITMALLMFASAAAWGALSLADDEPRNITTEERRKEPLLEYQRTGGFEGRADKVLMYANREVRIDTADGEVSVDPASPAVSLIARLVDEIVWATLQDRYVSEDKVVADGYRVRFVHDGKTIVGDEHLLPPELQRLTEELNALIEESVPSPRADRCATYPPRFEATYLPAGFSPRLRPGAGLFKGSDYPEQGLLGHYPGPRESVHVNFQVEGGPLPYDPAAPRPIEVLGATGRIGSIEGGFAVEFGFRGCRFRMDVYGVERAGVSMIARGLRPSPAGDRKQPGRTSIEEAVEYLAEQLDIPVGVPTNLPSGARLGPRRAVEVDPQGQVVTARLSLRFGKNGILIFDFGMAAFDGCGGDGAEVVDIAGENGLMLAKDRYPWTQVIWPADPGDRDATYGIYGSLPADEMLALARSMEVVAPTQGQPAGC